MLSKPPLLNQILAFRNEVSDVLNNLYKNDAKVLKDQPTKDRIRELVVTWNLSFSHLGTKVNSSLIDKTKTLLETAARLTSKSSKKNNYYKPLRLASESLEQIYIACSENKSLHYLDIPTGVQIIPEISDLPNSLVPKSLVGWIPKLQKFLGENPFDRNVFVMVRYRPGSENIIKSVVSAIKKIEQDGRYFNPVIARDISLTDDLDNTIACLLCCKFGVAIFDKVAKEPDINPNVAYEVGWMRLLQRDCLLLKDKKLKSLPTDILHKLYVPYSNPNSAAENVAIWLKGLSGDA
jgi:hypothetical protein